MALIPDVVVRTGDSRESVEDQRWEPPLRCSLHKALYGGEGTGPNPTDPGKLGWKWSVAVDRHGVPIGWTIDGANRNDVRMLELTLDDIAAAGLLVDIDTIHLDRGYDSGAVRQRLAGYGLTDAVIQRRGTKRARPQTAVRLGLRWIVEATNTWWSNYGQLRRNTDRSNRTPPRRSLPRHRRAHHRQTHHLARPMEPP